jgi:hypothetical protein
MEPEQPKQENMEEQEKKQEKVEEPIAVEGGASSDAKPAEVKEEAKPKEDEHAEKKDDKKKDVRHAGYLAKKGGESLIRHILGLIFKNMPEALILLLRSPSFHHYLYVSLHLPSQC